MPAEITSRVDSVCFKIYINNTLHLRLPIDRQHILQSWIEDSSNLFKIEISYHGRSELLEYENRSLWEAVLKEIDEKY